MENDKNSPSDRNLGAGDVEGTADTPATAPRARNRTVMLTPEITGQVRARLAQDFTHSPGSASAPGTATPAARGNDLGAPAPEPSGPASLGQFYAAGARGRQSSSPESPSAYAEPRSRSTPPSAPVPQPVEGREGVFWHKKTPVVGFLVSYDENPHGDVYELRSGRLIISSESAGHANCLQLNDESVSTMHAILRISQTGEVQVMDQLSEHGTRIKRFGSDEERELSGDKGTVEHGDIVSFGNRKFHVCMVASPPEG